MTWYGNIWKAVKNVFTRTKSEIDPNNYISAPKAFYKATGIKPTSRRYVDKGTSRFTKRTPSISVRQYQSAQHGVSIEKRATFYKSGTKPRTTPQSQVSQYITRHRHGVTEYHDIPWAERFRFMRSMRGHQVQIKFFGQPSNRSQLTGESGSATGSLWVSDIVHDGDEARDFLEAVDTPTGELGFNEYNKPEKVSFYVWRKGRPETQSRVKTKTHRRKT
jgi:hypothetical protein